MISWAIHHKAETVSTNLDARAGVHGDVFTADYQTAGRGRLDHKWLAPPGVNLAMSVVLDVGGRMGGIGARGGMGAMVGMGDMGAGGSGEIPPEEIATLPLVIGLAVVQAISKGPVPIPRRGLFPSRQGLSPSRQGPVPERTGRDLPEPLQRGLSPSSAGSVPSLAGVCPQAAGPLLKWPNDVLIGGKKVCGILCERHGDLVIAGIGINVKPRKFPPELAKTATWLGSVPSWGGVCPRTDGEGSPRTPPVGSVPASARTPPVGSVPASARTPLVGSVPISVAAVRDAVLGEIGELYEEWREGGFRSVYSRIREIDWLWGQTLAVRQTDDDSEPIRGVCGGIQPDGSLLVGATPVYAGEAHVEAISR